MADTLSDLYTKSPGTAAVASTPAATSSNATAQQAQSGLLSQASNYDANTQSVKDSDLTSSRLNTITSQDSPLMQRARSEGMLLAARRGLQNSSIAAGASEGAVVDRATPIAQQESSLLQNQQLANQSATNNASQFDAASNTQNSQFNTGQQNDISKTNAALGTDVSKLNAQNATETSRFNSESAQQNAQQNAQAENAMRTSVMNQNAELNKQYLSGTQSLDLASLQGKYQALIQSNAAAASLYNTYFQTISQVMSNTNMDPARAAQIVGSLQGTLAGGLDFMNAMAGLDSTGASGTPAAGTGAGAGGTPTSGTGSGGTYAPPPSAGTGAASGGTSIPPPTGTNVHLPAPVNGQQTQAFSSAGGEAATTAPAGAAEQAYGGLLSQAGGLTTKVADTSLAAKTGTGGALGAAGALASGAGGALAAIGGIKQGGAAGIGAAVAGASQVASALGMSTAATQVAGAVGNLMAGNVLGAAQSIAAMANGAAAGSAAAGASSAAGGAAAGSFTGPVMVVAVGMMNALADAKEFSGTVLEQQALANIVNKGTLGDISHLPADVQANLKRADAGLREWALQNLQSVQTTGKWIQIPGVSETGTATPRTPTPTQRPKM